MFSTELQKQNGIIGAFIFLAFGLVLFSNVSVAAQYRDDDDWRRERREERRRDRWEDRRDDRREDRRGGRWNDRWGYTDRRGIENLIRRVEQRTDSFVRHFDRALDNSRIDGTRREDRLNERAEALENSTDELRRRFDRSDSLRATRGDVERIMRLASDIDRVVRRGRIGNGVQNSWFNLRGELNALARAYNVRTI